MAQQVAALGIDECYAVGAAALQRYGHAIGREAGAGDAGSCGFIEDEAGNRTWLGRHSGNEGHADNGDTGHNQDTHADDQGFQS
jgi:hypothetical protein